MSSPDPQVAAEIEAAWAMRQAELEAARQTPEYRQAEAEYQADAWAAHCERDNPLEDSYDDGYGPREEYRVELWPFNRPADKPEVVSVFAHSPWDAEAAAAEKLGNATGLDYTDAFSQRATTWQPANAAEEGRAR